MFLFDTLGDAVGVYGAYWVLIVMPLVSLVDYLVYRVIVKWWGSGDNSNNNNNNNCSNYDNSFNGINNTRNSELEIVIIDNSLIHNRESV